MKPFAFERARNVDHALSLAVAAPGARFLAGGTNLLDLMKLEIETPDHLVDLNRLNLKAIEPTAEGGIRIGAMVSNTQLAADERAAPRWRAAALQRRRAPAAPPGSPAPGQTAAGAGESPALP